MYPEGKTKLHNQELLFLEYAHQIASRKTTIKYINQLIQLGWINKNEKTGCYILRSLDSITKFHHLENRLAFEINLQNYNKLKAVTGAVIYGYLHKDFWRKVKKKKSVQIKGSTYHFLSPKFNYKQQLAPVSVLSLDAIFSIPKATASRLKHAAVNAGYLKLQKNYSATYYNKKAMQHYLKYNDKQPNLVYHNGNYHLQLIDTVYPLFYFKKRKSLET